MKNKDRLNNLIQRVSVKAALILLGGLLFVNCGNKDDDDGKGGGSGSGSGPQSGARSENQAKQAKTDLYTGLVSRVGLGNPASMKTKDSFLKLCNKPLTNINDGDKNYCAYHFGNLIEKNTTGPIVAGDTDDATHLKVEGDTKGGQTLVRSFMIRHLLKGLIAEKDDKAEPSLFEGHIGEAVTAGLAKGLFGSVDCKSIAPNNDVGAKSKNVTWGSNLVGEASKSIWIICELMEKAKVFCEHFKEGDASKFDEKTFENAEGTVKEIEAFAKAKGDIKIEAANSALKLDGTTERDLGAPEKAAKDKLVEKLKAEIAMLKGLSPNAKNADDAKNAKSS